MQFQFNSDKQTTVGADVASLAESIVRTRLDRLADRLTCVELHLGEADSAKAAPQQLCCTIEARPAGMDPVSTSHHAPRSMQRWAGLRTSCSSFSTG